MKKIMFNDKYGLTKAVLEGRKTQTRRIITHPKTFHGKDVCGFYVCKRLSDGVVTDVCMYDEDESFIDEGQILPKYEIGEIVAVAQSYKTIDDYYKSAYSYNHSAHGMTVCEFDGVSDKDVHEWNMIAVNYRGKKVWTNKLYVKPELMLHFIRITNVRIELLKDISDEDCLVEGIIKGKCGSADTHFMDAYYVPNEIQPYCTPKEAYAELIDKVSGKGTWESNPYVFVYDFELIK